MAENAFQVGDEVRYEKFPARMVIKSISYDGQFYCTWQTSGKFDGYIRGDTFEACHLSLLLPRTTHPVDPFNLNWGTPVRDSRIVDKVDMMAQEMKSQATVGGCYDCRVYCIWGDDQRGFGYWFDYRDLEEGVG